jgi:hypothetical protein
MKKLFTLIALLFFIAILGSCEWPQKKSSMNLLDSINTYEEAEEKIKEDRKRAGTYTLPGKVEIEKTEKKLLAQKELNGKSVREIVTLGKSWFLEKSKEAELATATEEAWLHLIEKDLK